MIYSKTKTTLLISTVLALIMIISAISANASTYLGGDVDKDGKVSVSDVTYLQQVLAYLHPTSEYIDLVGDVDQDGKVSITDITIIQKYIARMITELPEFTDETESSSVTETETETQESTKSTDSEGWNNKIFQP